MTATTIQPTRPTTLTGASARRGTGNWRVAARLARREVRARWGRTLLVMVLVAVPVFGMTVVTVLTRTSQSAEGRAFAREFGSANLVAFGPVSTPSGGWPAGTRVAHANFIDEAGLVATNGTARLATITDMDLSDPVARGSVLLRAGRFPSGPGEALLSPKLARAFNVGVGGTLRLSQPAWTERVVGIGVRATNWTDGFINVRGNELAHANLQFALDQGQVLTLVKLPGHPSHATLQSYAPAYTNAATDHSNNTQRAVNWTLVAGMVALAIAGVVIAGAFAVGARRQLVTLGQLSANGAGEPLLRRMLSLQGVWSGMLGTALGLVAGVATLAVLHPHFNGWIHRDLGPFVWSARDLAAIAMTGVVTATIAAFIPARSAARVPILSALAGRRPLAAVPRSVVPIGAALFGFGVLVLALVSAASRNGSSGGDSLAFAAVLGGLLVLAGACCVTPVVVSSLAPFGRRLRGAGRVALRSIVRTRARSAAVVMALVAINGGAIAIGTAFASTTVNDFQGVTLMPNDSLVVTRRAPLSVDDSSAPFLAVPTTVVQTLHTILPKATITPRRAVLGSSVNGRSGVTGSSFGKGGFVMSETDAMIVADPAVLHLVGLSRADARALQRVGVLVLPTPDINGATRASSAAVTVGRGASAPTVQAPVAKHVRANGGVGILITPAKVTELGLSTVPAGVVITNPTPLDESQRASVDAVQPGLTFGPNATFNGDQPMTEILWSGPRSTSISADTVEQILLAIVVLIALIVLAMSLALSAAETRDERDVLVALGAKPATMRGVAAWKAGLLACTGAAIAVPTGFIPVAVAFLAAVRPGEHARLTFPWSTAIELVLIAPLLAAFVAAVGSAIAQRVRPTHMSTFATD